jgi:hypothetical protein
MLLLGWTTALTYGSLGTAAVLLIPRSAVHHPELPSEPSGLEVDEPFHLPELSGASPGRIMAEGPTKLMMENAVQGPPDSLLGKLTEGLAVTYAHGKGFRPCSMHACQV